jgi:hypothetical protein
LQTDKLLHWNNISRAILFYCTERNQTTLAFIYFWKISIYQMQLQLDLSAANMHCKDVQEAEKKTGGGGRGLRRST